LRMLMGEEVFSGYLRMMTLLLFVESYLNFEEYEEYEVLLLQIYLPHFMEQYKDVVDRQSGNGMKIIKFHLMLHLTNEIRRFGAPRNFYSGVGENQLKIKTKMHARKVKQTDDMMEQWTTDADIEKMALNRADKELAGETVNMGTPVCNRKGTAFYASQLIQNGIVVYGGIRQSWTKIASKWRGTYTLEDLDELVQSLEPKKKIMFFTECNLNLINTVGGTTKIRGHPTYNRQPWQDWIVAKIRGNSYKCHVLLFIEIFGNSDIKLLESGLDNIDGPGRYAIVHSCPCEDKNRNKSGNGYTIRYYNAFYNDYVVDANCELVTWNSKLTNEMQNWKSSHLVFTAKRDSIMPIIQYIKLERIIEPLIAVADVKSDMPFTYLFLKPPVLWRSIFNQMMLVVKMDSERSRAEGEVNSAEEGEVQSSEEDSEVESAEEESAEQDSEVESAEEDSAEEGEGVVESSEDDL
jgi:hypothetical protein